MATSGGRQNVLGAERVWGPQPHPFTPAGPTSALQPKVGGPGRGPDGSDMVPLRTGSQLPRLKPLPPPAARFWGPCLPSHPDGHWHSDEKPAASGPCMALLSLCPDGRCPPVGRGFRGVSVGRLGDGVWESHQGSQTHVCVAPELTWQASGTRGREARQGGQSRGRGPGPRDAEQREALHAVPAGGTGTHAAPRGAGVAQTTGILSTGDITGGPLGSAHPQDHRCAASVTSLWAPLSSPQPPACLLAFLAAASEVSSLVLGFVVVVWGIRYTFHTFFGSNSTLRKTHKRKVAANSVCRPRARVLPLVPVSLRFRARSLPPSRCPGAAPIFPELSDGPLPAGGLF